MGTEAVKSETPSPILSEAVEGEKAQGVLKLAAKDAADGTVTDTDGDGILDSIDLTNTPSADLQALTTSVTERTAADAKADAPEPDEVTVDNYTGAPDREPQAPAVRAATPNPTTDNRGIASYTLNGDRTIDKDYKYKHPRTGGSGGGRTNGGGSGSGTSRSGPLTDANGYQADVHSFLAGNISGWDDMSPTQQDALTKYVDKKYGGNAWDENSAEAAFKGIYEEVKSGKLKDGDSFLYHARPTRDTASSEPYLDDISDIDRLELKFKDQDQTKRAQALRHYQTVRAGIDSDERWNFVENIENPDQILALDKQEQVRKARTASGEEALPTKTEKREQATTTIKNGETLQKEADKAVEKARVAVEEALKNPDNQQILVLDRLIKEAEASAAATTADYDQQITDLKMKRDKAVAQAKTETTISVTGADSDTPARQAETETQAPFDEKIAKLEKERDAYNTNIQKMKTSRDDLDKKTKFSETREKYKTAKKHSDTLLEAMRQGDPQATNDAFKALTGEDPGLTQDDLTSEGLDARKATLEKKKDVIDAEAAAKRAKSDAKTKKFQDDLKLGSDTLAAGGQYLGAVKDGFEAVKDTQAAIDTLTRRDETKQRMENINEKLLEFMSGTLTARTEVTSETIATGFTTLQTAANPDKKEQTATQKAAHDRAYDAEARTAQLEARTARMSVSDDIETKEAEVEKTEAERDKLKAEAQAKWYKENPKYG